MWIEEQGKVLTNEQIIPGYYCMKLKLPGISAQAEPGQFIMGRVSYPQLCARELKSGTSYSQDSNMSIHGSTDPLLPRPISVFDVNQEMGELTILYQVVGKGTKNLSSLQTGDVLAVFGPLGRGFSLSQQGQIALVSGGIGIAPLYYLIRKLLQYQNNIHLFAGFLTEEQVKLLELFSKLDISIQVATEDGGVGYHGRVPQLLERFMQNKSQGFEGDCNINQIYTCGPEPMMSQIVTIANKYHIDSQLSLERKMACGVGACRSCACQAAEQAPFNLHVCSDGPVFNGEEVVLQNG